MHISGINDDALFRALADASRRQLLDRLHRDNGQTLGELCLGLAMTRQEKLHFINPVPINEIAERWMGKFERRGLAGLVMAADVR